MIEAQKCECDRLYKNTIRDDKTMCTICASEFDGDPISLETLKKLWGTPVPQYIFNLFR